MTQPEEITGLQRLVGKWKVDVLAKLPDGSELKGEGTVLAEPICSDCGVRTTLKAVVEGMGPYEEHDLWGYDKDTGLLHFYSVTSSGAVHDHVGKAKDGTTMEFSWKGRYDGIDTVEKVVVEFASSKELHVHETDTVEGRRGPVFDYYLKRL